MRKKSPAAGEINAHADDRLNPLQGAPLGEGRKKVGKQAVGRSRGARNTKIHAVGDVKGRLIVT